MQTPFTTMQTPFTSTTIDEDFQDEDSIFPPVPSTGVGKERGRTLEIKLQPWLPPLSPYLGRGKMNI
ncbi:hypothetical protein COP2_044242 [Malus domestica]